MDHNRVPMSREEFFKNALMLLLYPFGSLVWVSLCRKWKLDCAKMFFNFSLLGFLSWLLVYCAFLVSGTLRVLIYGVSLGLYICIMIPYVRLCWRCVQAIEEAQQKKSLSGLGRAKGLKKL